MHKAIKAVFYNFIPVVLCAFFAIILVSIFYNEHYSVRVTDVTDYQPADDKVFCEVESVVYEGGAKDVLVVRGWAADTKLYSGYNYGAEMTVTSVYNETYFALTDGEHVYRLKTMASERGDISARFPETNLPEGVGRRFGIKGVARCGGKALPDPAGMEVCVISVRRDEGPVIAMTGVTVP